MHRSAYIPLVAIMMTVAAADEQESLTRLGKERAALTESAVERTLFALEED